MFIEFLSMTEPLAAFAAATSTQDQRHIKPLQIETFFSRLFEVYDLRFPLRAARLAGVRRVAWREDSPLFEQLKAEAESPLDEILGYSPRLAD